MKYLKTFENIEEEKYIGKYIVFYRQETKLYFGKVEDIIKRRSIRENDRYFVVVSNLYPKIPALKEQPIIKFYLERMNILNSFKNEKDAMEFYNIEKKAREYNI